MITAVVFLTLDLASWPVAMIAGFGVIAAVVLVALRVAIKDQRDRRRQGPA
jgi:hypothetical protein